jgi:hypothetical protein
VADQPRSPPQRSPTRAIFSFPFSSLFFFLLSLVFFFLFPPPPFSSLFLPSPSAPERHTAARLPCRTHALAPRAPRGRAPRRAARRSHHAPGPHFAAPCAHARALPRATRRHHRARYRSPAPLGRWAARLDARAASASAKARVRAPLSPPTAPVRAHVRHCWPHPPPFGYTKPPRRSPLARDVPSPGTHLATRAPLRDDHKRPEHHLWRPTMLAGLRCRAPTSTASSAYKRGRRAPPAPPQPTAPPSPSPPSPQRRHAEPPNTAAACSRGHASSLRPGPR